MIEEQLLLNMAGKVGDIVVTTVPFEVTAPVTTVGVTGPEPSILIWHLFDSIAIAVHLAVLELTLRVFLTGECGCGECVAQQEPPPVPVRERGH